ncbi:MAG: glycoside hydrolase family 127 protein, partial [Defluviitaleaceae bacterium]|nr:glycoside hydrolase family 127 protein [Defluviitaleaceae bacterium]
MNALAMLKQDANAIYIGNLNTVEADLKLPSKGKNGSDIVWVSTHPYVVNASGKVTRPHAGTGNRNLTLTAHLSYEGKTLEVPFHLTVLARELSWTATKLLPTQVSVELDKIHQLVIPGAVVAEKDTGGYSSIAVKWPPLPIINTTGTYRITGTPPVKGKPDLVPEAIIHVQSSQDSGLLPKPKLNPFPLQDVTINAGIFASNKRRMLEWLQTVNDDTMLYNFRDAAGIDTKSAPPMTGWDAPECLLKGHTTGHYLSALSLAVCSGENEELFRDKLCYMVSGLAECQKVMGETGRFKEGFLSGYAEDQFDLLQEYVPYPSIWAPYYTLHKIFAGLLDAYELAGIQQALQIAEKLGLWVYNRLAACDPEMRRKMWAMYIAGEYGGMNEIMARLHRLSHKPEYLTAARFFDNDLLFYPMQKNINTLPGIHGNQHVPQMVGAVEMYEQSLEKRYYDTAANFWSIVTQSHTYSIGGLGEGEMFKDANKLAAHLSDKTAESCASYNMLKLTARLYNYTVDSTMADYYERTLYNHILASHDQSG